MWPRHLAFEMLVLNHFELELDFLALALEVHHRLLLLLLLSRHFLQETAGSWRHEGVVRFHQGGPPSPPLLAAADPC